MTAEEKELAKRLVAVYCQPVGTTQADMDAWNAHAANVEQDLPWDTNWSRAVWIQDLAWRYVTGRKARGHA